MIKFEHTAVVGWEHAIRGMRNPLNSWDKSDSYEAVDCGKCGRIEREGICEKEGRNCTGFECYALGENDLDLMQRLRSAGTDHRKYLRMIVVYVDITAPLYWWKEFKTYRAGRKFCDEEPDIVPIPCEYLEYDIEMNSCSTMHKIASKEFEFDDFSHEHLTDSYCLSNANNPVNVIEHIIECLNFYRKLFNETNNKEYWWQMIQLLPSSYNQKRTVMLNYEVLNSIYKQRKNHKLDEWSVGFINWIKTLPYAKELIIGEE